MTPTFAVGVFFAVRYPRHAMGGLKTPIGKAAAAAAVGLSWAFSSPAQQVALPAPQFAPPNLTAKGVAALAMNCAICHGPDGRPAPGSSIAGLAGRGERELFTAMRQFKEGSRAGTLMYQVARGYSDDEIAALARYFSSVPAKAQR